MNQPAPKETMDQYRAILETAAVSIWEEDFSWCKSAIDDIKAKGTDFPKYLGEHPHFAAEARQKVKVLSVNRQSLRLFEAKDKDELMASLDRIFLPESLSVFSEQLVAIAEGRNYFESETIASTLRGKRINILVAISFPEQGASFDRIPVTLFDITERKQAEANYREIFEKANDAIYVHELETGRVLDVNNKAIEISGFTKDEIINGNPSDFMAGTPGFTLEDAMRFMQKAATEGRQTFEWHARHKNGSLFWVEVNLYRASIAGTDRILAFFHDIEDRKKAEEKVKSSELEYRALIEQATDGIFISDEKGKYIDANQSACQMLGYSREELLSMTVQDVLVPGEAERNPPKFNELLSGKAILSRRNLQRKNGSVMPVEINAKMLSNGKMLGMVRDITERKVAEEKLAASEEKFRNLTETAFDAIVLIDEEGNIIFWNRGAELIFGYSKQEVMQKPLTLMMPEKYRQAHTGGIERYLRTGENKVIGKVVALEGMRKNGEIFPIEISITSWEAANRKLFSGIIRDITERKKAEDKIQKLNEALEQKVIDRTAQLESKVRQLKESEEKFEKTFQASAAGITITRLSDSKYLDVNEAFIRMTGFSREELINHSSTELGLIVDLKRRDEILEQIRAHGFARQFEMTVHSKSGGRLEVLSSVDTVLLNGEKFAINIIYDITERKKAEEKLELANSELEAFSYSVSHDLRAPLRSITGYALILEEDLGNQINEEGRKTLEAIQRNASKMNRLIDDLLAFSKLGKQELQKSEVNTAAVVNKIILELSDSARSRVDFKINSLPSTYADPSMLTQTWVNLISNAIKYSAKKENPVVEIGSFKQDKEVVYYIKDNGAGFSMEYADKLFGVFQRLHRSADFEGTGVGLALVKRIVAKHGGRVWAEGKVNEGATFYFSLPA
jgi:PAS domain S-box-containing protein